MFIGNRHGSASLFKAKVIRAATGLAPRPCRAGRGRSVVARGVGGCAAGGVGRGACVGARKVECESIPCARVARALLGMPAALLPSAAPRPGVSCPRGTGSRRRTPTARWRPSPSGKTGTCRKEDGAVILSRSKHRYACTSLRPSLLDLSSISPLSLLYLSSLLYLPSISPLSLLYLSSISPLSSLSFPSCAGGPRACRRGT